MDYEDDVVDNDDGSTGFTPVEIPDKRTTKSDLESMFDLFVAIMHNELKNFAKLGIPLSASDKNVYMTFFKNNDVVALPDDEKMAQLKEAFDKEIKEGRMNAQSKLLNNVNTALQDAGLNSLLN